MLPLAIKHDAPTHWAKESARLLESRGRLFMIVRPDAVFGTLQALEGSVGGIALKPIHAKREEPAIRVLIGAIRGSHAPLTMLPGLVLHDAKGDFTAESAALHDGCILPLVPTKTGPAKGRLQSKPACQ